MSETDSELEEILKQHNVYFWKQEGKTVHLSDNELRVNFKAAISGLIATERRKAAIEELKGYIFNTWSTSTGDEDQETKIHKRIAELEGATLSQEEPHHK